MNATMFIDVRSITQCRHDLDHRVTGSQGEALKGQAVSMVMSKDWLHSLSALKRGNPLDLMQDPVGPDAAEFMDL